MQWYSHWFRSLINVYCRILIIDRTNVNMWMNISSFIIYPFIHHSFIHPFHSFFHVFIHIINPSLLIHSFNYKFLSLSIKNYLNHNLYKHFLVSYKKCIARCCFHFVRKTLFQHGTRFCNRCLRNANFVFRFRCDLSDTHSNK